MCLSVGGMLAYFIILAGMMDDYYYVANWLYADNLFWFFGFFSEPIFTLYIDAATFFLRSTFFPTKETLYREAEQIHHYQKDPLATLRSDLTFPRWNRKELTVDGAEETRGMEEGRDEGVELRDTKQTKRGPPTRSI